MTDTTDVQLVKNDGSETFNLKAESVEVNVSNNLVARAILSAAGDFAGADPVLNTEKYQVTGIMISDIDDSDFPTGRANGSIPNSENNERMESALRRAAKEWGPDTSDGFDQLKWNHQSIDVIITSYGATESAEQPRDNIFMADLELTHVDVYVG